jgi:hypothetical protein
MNYFIVIYKYEEDKCEPVKTEYFENESHLWKRIQELTNQKQYYSVFLANMVFDNSSKH